MICVFFFVVVFFGEVFWFGLNVLGLVNLSVDGLLILCCRFKVCYVVIFLFSILSVLGFFVGVEGYEDERWKGVGRWV